MTQQLAVVRAFIENPGKISFARIDKPNASSDGVVVRVHRLGICGSDLHVYQGRNPRVRYPFFFGHEVSGVVEEKGIEVSGLELGEPVTIQPAVSCGLCDKCRGGLFAQCSQRRFIGNDLPGAAAPYIEVNAGTAFSVPTDMDLDQAVMIEPLAVAVHAVRKITEIQSRCLLVAGGGPVGNLCAQVARSFGARGVVILETKPYRRNFAESLGFDTGSPSGGDSTQRETKAHCQGESVNAAIECSGNPDALNQLISMVDPGGYVILVGVMPGLPGINIERAQDRELHIIGSAIYTWEDYREAVDLIRNDRVDVKKLQTHHLPFDRIADGFELLLDDRNEAMKVLIDL